MLGIGAITTPIGLTTPAISSFCNSNSRISYAGRIAPPNSVAIKNKTLNFSSKFPPHFSLKNDSIVHRCFSSKAAAAAASSVEWTEETVEEPATNVKFSTSLSLPGCQSSLSLLGTGFREKVFVIVGVKVYAAGLYVNQSILTKLDTWKGRSASEVQNDAALFDTIFQAPLEKSLHIALVRDVDGKTFWEALDEAISPRIKSPASVDESALSTFRAIFEGRPLRNATSIFLTWPDTTKMLVSLSSEGKPSGVDATIESKNVAAALFDVFLGDKPVSPSLKASVASGLAKALK